MIKNIITWTYKTEQLLKDMKLQDKEAEKMKSIMKAYCKEPKDNR